MRRRLLGQYKTVDAEDLRIYKIVNSAKEAFKIIKKSKPRQEFSSRK